MAELYDIVPASIRHIKPLALTLRPADCATFLAFGADPRRSLHRALRVSRYSRTAIIHGEPAAMWGMHGTALSDHATVWAAIGSAATRFPLAIVRRARAELAEMMSRDVDLRATVSRGDERAFLFAQTLGFHATDSFEAGDGMQPMIFGRTA